MNGTMRKVFIAGGTAGGVAVTTVVVYLFATFVTHKEAAAISGDAKAAATTAARGVELGVANEAAHRADHEQLSDIKADVRDVRGEVKEMHSTINSLYREVTGHAPSMALKGH